jgi:hypothetical protein
MSKEFVIGIGTKTFRGRGGKPYGRSGRGGLGWPNEIEGSPAEYLRRVFYFLPVVIVRPVDLGGIQFTEEDIFVLGTGAWGESIRLKDVFYHMEVIILLP